MGVLSDRDIRARRDLPEGHQQRLVIKPFADGIYETGTISYGVSSYGYDLRLGYNFRFPVTEPGATLDPKNPGACRWEEVVTNQPVTLPANSFCLAESLEVVEISRDVIAVCVGKSSYARVATIANITPLEPLWRGKVTLEISNSAPIPSVLYPGEGIIQVIFLVGETVCLWSYADKGGKYQGQTGVTLARV